MADKQTTKKSALTILPFILASAALACIAILIIPLALTKPNGTSSLAVVAAITGAISAFFWIVSAYVPDIEARRLNATAGGFSGTSIVLGAGTLANMPNWWHIIAYLMGLLLAIATLVTALRRVTGKPIKP